MSTLSSMHSHLSPIPLEKLVENPFQARIRQDPCYMAAVALLRKPLFPGDALYYERLKKHCQSLENAIHTHTAIKATPGYIQKIKNTFNKICGSDSLKELRSQWATAKRDLDSCIFADYEKIEELTREPWRQLLSNPTVAVLAALGVDPRLATRSIFEMEKFRTIDILLGVLKIWPLNVNCRLIDYQEGGSCSEMVLEPGAHRSYSSANMYRMSQPVTYLILVTCLEATVEFRNKEAWAARISKLATDILKETYRILPELNALIEDYAAFFPYENDLEANLAKSKGEYVEKMLISPSTKSAPVDRNKPWYGVLNELLASDLLNPSPTH